MAIIKSIQELEQNGLPYYFITVIWMDGSENSYYHPKCSNSVLIEYIKKIELQLFPPIVEDDATELINVEI